LVADGEASVTLFGGSLRKWRRWAAIAFAVAVVLFVAVQLLTWPRIKPLAQDRPATTAFIERHKLREAKAGRTPSVDWRWLPYAKISPHLKRAVLVAEDIEFFSHRGFSDFEMKEALRDAMEERHLPRGASTLTQQLAKNLWLSPSRNPWRKLKEGLLTRSLERHLEKRRILELYLNVVEFGPGIYGAGAAAQRYFGKPAGELDASQAALLAAGLPKPSRWHPGSNSLVYRRRAARIEQRAAQAEWLAKHL
jgi:monofunctional biosynthetic peptidoglycan transglycosylase